MRTGKAAGVRRSRGKKKKEGKRNGNKNLPDRKVSTVWGEFRVAGILDKKSL